MKCARCGRYLRKPGEVLAMADGRTVMLGPVCARRVHGVSQERREPVVPRTRQRAGRVDQPGLFDGVA